MLKNKLTLILILLSIFAITSCSGESNSGSKGTPVTPLSVTLNPVLDFYINRTYNTDGNAVVGYGTDSVGNNLTGHTGSATGYSAGPGYNYQNFFKLLFNFDVSILSGSEIKSAYFRIYLNNISGADNPENAIMENIFYGSTNSFPDIPRNYADEFNGYLQPPAVDKAADATTVGWVEFDVAEKLQGDIDAGRVNSQFRLSHENSASLFNYSCIWNMADNAVNQPELVITYVP